MDSSARRLPEDRVLASLEGDHESLDCLIFVLDEALGCDDYDASLFDTAFNRLVEDVERHFRKEEAWMRHLGYPAAQEHTDQHATILDALVDFRRGFTCNPARSNAYVIRSFVDDWLVHHMTEVDGEFETYAERS